MLRIIQQDEAARAFRLLEFFREFPDQQNLQIIGISAGAPQMIESQIPGVR